MIRWALAVFVIGSFASPSTRADALPTEFQGMWMSPCAIEGETQFATRDILDIRGDVVIQRSLTFYKGGKNCDSPNVVSMLSFRGTSTADPKAKGAKLMNLNPYRVAIAANTVEGAVLLTNKHECGLKSWDAHRYHDCTAAEPYKTFVAGQKFKLSVHIDGTKFISKELGDDGETSQEEVYEKITSLPYNLQKIE